MTTSRQPARSNLPSFILGYAIRTDNAAENDPARAQIGALWQRVLEDEALLRWPGRRGQELYAAIYDYESDESGPYSQIVGIGVETEADTPEEWTSTGIGTGRRVPFTVDGPMPESLIDVWHTIWSKSRDDELNRSYTCDVEVHRLDGTATILIAVN
jgi:predicted transcriptional regulator YdeE